MFLECVEMGLLQSEVCCECGLGFLAVQLCSEDCPVDLEGTCNYKSVKESVSEWEIYQQFMGIYGN